MLDKLWNTMEAELYQLAFDQENIDTLTREDLIMERIKDLSIVIQHAAVHTVTLHSEAQEEGKSTTAFVARVQGIASNCNLMKKCMCECDV